MSRKNCQRTIARLYLAFKKLSPPLQSFQLRVINTYIFKTFHSKTVKNVDHRLPVWETLFLHCMNSHTEEELKLVKKNSPPLQSFQMGIVSNI